MKELIKKADVLIEALPYIRQFSDKIVVIKYGGSAMENNVLKQNVIQDIVLMKFIGIKPVIVHGGGKKISEIMSRMGKIESNLANRLFQAEPNRPQLPAVY